MAMFEDIELRENNLYINGKVIEFTADKEAILQRPLIQYAGTEGDKYHLLLDEQSLDELAELYYGQVVQDASKYWWIIADVNNVYNPLDLTDWVGKELLIPDILRIKLDISSI